MRLFFHHVGQKGADEDFKKTVYKDISIETVESNVPVSYPHRDELLSQLRRGFLLASSIAGACLLVPSQL